MISKSLIVKWEIKLKKFFSKQNKKIKIENGEDKKIEV